MENQKTLKTKKTPTFYKRGNKTTKTRSNTRNFKEAFQCVLQYRDNYYKLILSNGKQGALKEAAYGLQIKKKTLDDYTIQFKKSFLTGYDFTNPGGIDMKQIRKHNNGIKKNKNKNLQKKCKNKCQKKKGVRNY